MSNFLINYLSHFVKLRNFRTEIDALEQQQCGTNWMKANSKKMLNLFEEMYMYTHTDTKKIDTKRHKRKETARKNPCTLCKIQMHMQ